MPGSHCGARGGWQERGVKAKFFHSELELVGEAGSGRSGRLEVHEDWATGRLQVRLLQTDGAASAKADVCVCSLTR